MTSLSTGESYTYDANGNMTCRVEGGITYKQDYNFENLLSAVHKMNGTCASGTILETTQFVYDGDGNLVKKTKPDGSKTIYVGGVYEIDKTSGGSVTRTVTYYPVAGAMRINSTLYYTLKDHLGSASVVTDSIGNPSTTLRASIVGETRYFPYGETRLTTGTMYTDKLYTGQREMAGLGIYHYNARFYSPKLGRFLSADTIVPGMSNPQNLNRYMYVSGNPLKYTDPTGHAIPCEQGDICDHGDSGNSGGTDGGNTNDPNDPTDDDEDDDHGETGSGSNDSNANECTILTGCISYDTQNIAGYLPGTADQWASASLFLDYTALGVDVLAALIVLGYVTVGAGGGLTFEGNPVTGGAGAAAGYILGEFNPAVRSLVNVGNSLAFFATLAGVVASAKSGDYRAVASARITQSGVDVSATVRIPGSTVASVALTEAGLVAQPVSISLPLQTLAVMNDHGVFHLPTLSFGGSFSVP